MSIFKSLLFISSSELVLPNNKHSMTSSEGNSKFLTCGLHVVLLVLKRRFLQDEKLFESYKTTMEEYIAKGHARKVPCNEVHVDDKRPLWYLPHHPVLNKPGKTRVVFDCAAKYGEHLLTISFLLDRT